MTKLTHFFKILVFFTFLIILSSCEALKYKKTEAGEVPVNAKDRVAKNIEEGRGFRLFGNEKKGGTFDFASSNELWRATLDILDFLPLATVDYSGGVIISDWYADNNKDGSIKISIRFLSNEVRSDSLKIIVHKRVCGSNQSCRTSLLENSKISQELLAAIIRKAAILEKDSKKKKK